MAKAIYRGYSTLDWLRRRSFGASNIDLVKRDLLNHIYTMKGERVMMPGFGTRIPMLAFEPNDETTRAVVETDLREVFNYDPRVKLLALNVMSLADNNAILALADILYVEFNVKDTLHIEVPTK